MTETLSDDAFVRLFQRTFGLEEDGWAGRDTIAKLRALAEAVGAPVPQAPEAIPDAYWSMLAQIESGGRPYVKAKTSSASGLYQFIRSTWLAEGGAWGVNPSLAFGGLKPSEGEQLQRAKTFTAKNAAELVRAGVPVNEASLYACHFLGAHTAVQVLAAPIEARADHLAGEAATRANRSILEGKTVGQFLSWLHRKTGVWVR